MPVYADIEVRIKDGTPDTEVVVLLTKMNGPNFALDEELKKLLRTFGFEQIEVKDNGQTKAMIFVRKGEQNILTNS